MRYWWVNQNKTFKFETRGGFMWSPKQNVRGIFNKFYENMQDVSPGDVVFSFCDTRIKAIGIATGTADTSQKPDFGAVENDWAEEGWYVPVEYHGLAQEIRPKDHIDILRPFLPSKYSPLQVTGNGLQSVYLTEVPSLLADALIALIGQAYWDAYAALSAFLEGTVDEASEVQRDRVLAGPTSKPQVLQARRGQGLFRSNVLLRERSCRVTKVDDPRHLKASHIKPWRDASDAERLDGSNGLLLSPHIDHLFDAGYITFSSSQTLIIVPEVRDTLLDAWGIDAGVQVGSFSSSQSAYLDYHRANVFKHALLE